MHGAVYVSLPENYAANIETGTVNGTFLQQLERLTKGKKRTASSRAVQHAFKRRRFSRSSHYYLRRRSHKWFGQIAIALILVGLLQNE
jgi:hypothetical protein